MSGQTVGEVLEAIQRGIVPPPHLIRREVPKALSAVCLKAMAPKPELRYSSAQALAEDVERWLADEPVIAHQDSVADRAARWLRHNRTWFRAVMIATLLVIGILITSVFLIDGQRQIAEDARGRAVKLAAERTELANRESKLRKHAEWQSANRSFEQSLLLCERVDAITGLLSLVANLKEAEQIGATDIATSIRSQIGQWQGAVHSLEKLVVLESSIVGFNTHLTVSSYWWVQTNRPYCWMLKVAKWSNRRLRWTLASSPQCVILLTESLRR